MTLRRNINITKENHNSIKTASSAILENRSINKNNQISESQLMNEEMNKVR